MKKIPYEKSLEYLNAELAKQWHPKKNGGLKPSDISAKSKNKVWWFKPYDDPITKKHFEFEWEADVSSRAKGVGCPYLSYPPKKIYKGFNDFETYCIETDRQDLLDEWHPTKNGVLKPSDIIAGGSMHKVWWLKPYDDPITGKHFEFEWESYVYSRIKKVGCPFLSNPAKAAWYGFNDVETYCIQNDLQYILEEWHPTKNGELKPNKCVRGSEVKVWWLKPYDDPITRKHFDFEWKANLNTRIMEGHGCPFLTNTSVWPGFNDMETVCKQNGMEYLLDEWDYNKNGIIKPNIVMAKSGKKVWWLYPYDDPITGKHFDFSWKTTIQSRYSGKHGCPYLSGQSIWPGFNDLETYCRHNGTEYILDEWHPTKNGDKTPVTVLATSSQKIWWLYSYDDPITGKHFEFEWKANLNTRTTEGYGCPFLSNTSVWPGFNDFETYCKNHDLKNLLEEWNYDKNKINPTMLSPNSNMKVWWIYPYDDPITGKHFDFEWQAQVNSRMKGNGCPFLVNMAVWPGFNDLETYCINNGKEEFLAEWHPVKNGDLKPSEALSGGCKVVWWCKPYDDPVTGKHFEFEWKTSISNRISGCGCPFLSNKKVWSGFNDLETYCHLNGMEYLLNEWDYDKNRLTPDKVLPCSGKKIFWKKSYADLETGKYFNFEWRVNLNSRVTSKTQCPFLTANPSLWQGFNDLETWCKLKGMQYLLEEWHPIKNRKITPRDVTHSSGIKRWWKCNNGHEWRISPNGRSKGALCPYCS